MRKPSKKAKRGNGEGSPYQVKDGSWRAAITLPRKKGEKRKRRVVRAASRVEALAKLATLQAKAPKRIVAGSDMTVEGLISLWRQSQTLDESTKESYDWNEKHLGWLREVQVQSLTALVVAKWYAEKNAAIGARSLQIVASLVKRCCAFAVEIGILAESPFTMKVSRAKPKDIQPFEEAEVRQILAESATDRVGGVVDLGFNAGLRQGECFGLRWRDVDWAACDAIVVQQVVEVRGKALIVTPKTKRSKRRVHLCPAAMDALWRRRCIALREGRVRRDDLVYPSLRGRPMKRSVYRRHHWKPLLAKLQIRHRGLHHARHTYATTVLAAGIAVEFVSQQLGHASPKTTWETYTHWIPAASKHAAQSIDSALRGFAVASATHEPQILPLQPIAV